MASENSQITTGVEGHSLDRLVRLFNAAKEAEPLLRVLENRMASSLSCDSRSHDADREPRRLLQAMLTELKEPNVPDEQRP